jgi:hypothetical protein
MKTAPLVRTYTMSIEGVARESAFKHHGGVMPRSTPGIVAATVKALNQSQIVDYIARSFDGVDVVVGSPEHGDPEVAWGDTFFSYDPNQNLPPHRRTPFCTIVTKNYPGWDEASNLNRPNVYRVNVGLSRDAYRALFPDETTYDFTSLDQLMPHPVYGRQHWVCVVNPTDAMFERLKPLLQDAYSLAVRRSEGRAGPTESRGA